jgi:hypothetical protein
MTGTNIAAFANVILVANCMAKCQSHPGCAAFNYDKIHLICYLLGALGTKQENPFFVSAPKVAATGTACFPDLGKLNLTMVVQF